MERYHVPHSDVPDVDGRCQDENFPICVYVLQSDESLHQQSGRSASGGVPENADGEGGGITSKPAPTSETALRYAPGGFRSRRPRQKTLGVSKTALFLTTPIRQIVMIRLGMQNKGVTTSNENSFQVSLNQSQALNDKSWAHWLLAFKQEYESLQHCRLYGNDEYSARD